MIKHVMLWKLRTDLPGRTVADIAGELEPIVRALPADTGVVQRIEVGVNTARIPEAYDMCVQADFADADAFAVFLTHPAHLRLGEHLKAVRDTWAVVDYDV